jgi:hypothetical protein
VTELEKLKSAASIVEEMTQGKQTFHGGIGGAYISADDSANFKLLMDTDNGDSPDHCRITFRAYPKTTDAGLDCGRLRDFLTEANQLYALLLTVEMQEYLPTYEEYSQFTAYVQRTCQQGPMLEQTF